MHFQNHYPLPEKEVHVILLPQRPTIPTRYGEKIDFNEM